MDKTWQKLCTNSTSLNGSYWYCEKKGCVHVLFISTCASLLEKKMWLPVSQVRCISARSATCLKNVGRSQKQIIGVCHVTLQQKHLGGRRMYQVIHSAWFVLIGHFLKLDYKCRFDAMLQCSLRVETARGRPGSKDWGPRCLILPDFSRDNLPRINHQEWGEEWLVQIPHLPGDCPTSVVGCQCGLKARFGPGGCCDKVYLFWALRNQMSQIVQTYIVTWE